MACKHIKAKRCGLANAPIHDFPCAVIDGNTPTQLHINSKFYVDFNNPALGGCDPWVVVGVYGCGTIPTFPTQCNNPVLLLSCGVGVSSYMFADCDACRAVICPIVSGCTDAAALNYDPLATFNDGSCTYGLPPAGNCYCCFNSNVVGVAQQIPAGQACSSLNGSNGFSNCSDNHLLVVCKKPIGDKHCYCCDGTSPIGVNQAANPLPPGQDCSYYNSPSGNGWFDCNSDWTVLNCDSNHGNSNCTCCDNGVGISMGPSPAGTNCNFFNTLGYTNCDTTPLFDVSLCSGINEEHCACCKNGQMTMIGLPLPNGESCGYWSGMYGWDNCTGHTYFNIDNCEDCHCDELIGTGRTSAFTYNQEDSCLEGCCDPDLKHCDVLVVGDNEGVQVYSTTGDNTTHLFDVHSHDIKDIASNGNFIWVYRVTGVGTQIDEYEIVMAPFTHIYIRTITVTGTDIGNGLTFYGINAGNTLLTSVNDKTLLIIIPPGNTNIVITTPVIANNFPGTINGSLSGYKCTGDILTRGLTSGGMHNSLDVILYDNGTTHKVAKVKRSTGSILEEHTIDQAILTGTTKFHSLYTDKANNRLAGITTDGRIYELEQSPTLQFGSLIIGSVDFYNSGQTKTVYGATNIDYSDGKCSSKILVYPKTYDCTINGCVDPGNGLGQYTGPTASADCDTLCVITWNCNPGTGYPNCTNVVQMLPWSISSTIPAVQTGPDAILWVSTSTNGLQYIDFNTIGFYWGVQPVIPGQCSKWSSSGPRGQWKISEISHPQLTTTLPIQSWAQFIVELNNAGVTTVNLGMSYTQVEIVLYSHYGPSYQIDVKYEPCICTQVPCECTPLIGATGTFPDEPTCMTTCCPPPPCTVCCQSNTSNYPQPGYSWMSTSPTTPCYCPSNSSQVPCITCNKCCTNGTIQVMLGVNDQNCDCSFYGLYSCYLPPCDKCCYNKHTGMVSPAQLPDCNCKQGEWTVPCHSLPDDVGIACLPTTPITTPTTTTTTVAADEVKYTLDNNNVVTGTNTSVTSATKIYVIYDSSSLGTTYITMLKSNINDWLVSNGLTTANVGSVSIGDERWIDWTRRLYNGTIPFQGGAGTPLFSDDVLLIVFQDEAESRYHPNANNGNSTVTPTGHWMGDYLDFKTSHSQITGNFKGVLYPTSLSNSIDAGRRGFAMHALQAISSGNKYPLNGMWNIGTAPRPASLGGTISGTPGLCSNANLHNLETSNPYWNGLINNYGGLDQFGWTINIRFEPVTSSSLIYDLNSLLPSSGPVVVIPATPIQGTVTSQILPSTYNSSAVVAYYLCTNIPAPDGTGSGCYGFGTTGLWTSPVTGAAYTGGCTPWHLGGNCYGVLNQSDFPINTPNGPVGSPPEKACNDDCLYS